MPQTASLNRASADSALDERCFHAVAESTSDMITVVDAEGRRVYANPAFVRLLGETGSLVGSDSFLDIHPEDRERMRALLRRVTTEGSGMCAEYRLIDGLGRTRFLESQSNVVCDGNAPLRVVVVSRDVTERKQMEEALSRLSRELKARIATANHEFRTPLTTILSASELLRSYDTQFTGKERLDMLDGICNAVGRMTAMLDQALAIDTLEARYALGGAAARHE